MDIGGLPNKLINGAEKHATLLAFAGATFARANESLKEGTAVSTNILEEVMYELNPLRVTEPDTFNNNGPIGEIMYLLGIKPGTAKDPIRNIKWKLWDSPHAPTQIGKIAAIVWGLSKVTGVVPKRYEDLAEKIAIGSYAAAILLPGSSWEDQPQVNNSPRSNGSIGNRGY